MEEKIDWLIKLDMIKKYYPRTLSRFIPGVTAESPLEEIKYAYHSAIYKVEEEKRKMEKEKRKNLREQCHQTIVELQMVLDMSCAFLQEKMGDDEKGQQAKKDLQLLCDISKHYLDCAVEFPLDSDLTLLGKAMDRSEI